MAGRLLDERQMEGAVSEMLVRCPLSWRATVAESENEGRVHLHWAEEVGDCSLDLVVVIVGRT